MQALKNNTWSDMRRQVEAIRQELMLPVEEFRPLEISEWQGLEERVYQHFCTITHPTARPLWMWSTFKLDTAWLPYDGTEPLQHLPKLIPPHEKVWLLLMESGFKDKFWLYEGRIASIVRVLLEVYGLDETVIVSKKLEWLLCLEHHDNLVATGDGMPNRLRALLR